MYEKELEKILKEAGADLVGFSSLGENRSPEHPEYGYAVTIVRKLSRAVIKTINGAPTMEYFQHYRATNARLDSIALDAVSFIENAGYLALPVAASQSTPDKKDEYLETLVDLQMLVHSKRSPLLNKLKEYGLQ